MTSEAHLKVAVSFEPNLAKNLFVKDKKGKFWLVVAKHNSQTPFKGTDQSLQKLIGAECRFAEAKVMEDMLGVAQVRVLAHYLT